MRNRRDKKGWGRGEALQEEIPPLAAPVISRAERNVARDNKRDKAGGIQFGWCHSAAPQLFGPVSLKSIAQYLSVMEHTFGPGTHPWIACISSLHMHTYIRCSSENHLVNSWWGRIFKRNLWFSDAEYLVFPEIVSKKEIKQCYLSILNIHVVWSSWCIEQQFQN